MNRIQSFLDGYGPHMGAVLVLSIVAAAYAQDGPNLRFEAAQAETSATCATGAVGLDYIVSVWQPGDSDSPALDVFSKSGVLLQRVPLSSLFEDSTAFGPAVLFDTHRQRFVLAAHGYRSSLAGVSTLALAVSRTANPLEGWHSFAITHPGHLTGIKLGFNRHWYAITAYDAYAPLAPGRPHLYVFDSGAAANGAVKVTAFDLTRELGVLEYFDPFAAPAATYDASDRLYIAGTHTNDTGSGSTGLLRMARIEGTVADPVFVSAPLFPTGPAWARLASAFPNTVPNAPQPQGVTAVEAIQGPDGAWNDSVSTAIYRNGYLWCAQMIGAGSGASARPGVQWWQISPLTGTTIRTGRLADATAPSAAWFAPALAVNSANEMFFTVNRSSAAEAISAYYMIVDGSDTILRRLNAGSGSLSGPLGALWPPGNGAAVDPVDGRAFWGYARHLAGANAPAYGWAKVNPVPVELGFRSESLFVAEGASAFAEVVLSDSILEAVAVNFVTVDGTAVYGQDYLVRVDGQDQALGTVIISAGQTRAALEIVAIDDGEQESVTETASIDLFASTKGLSAANTRIELVLGDSEERPALFFEETAITLSETGGGSVDFNVAMDSAAGSVLPVNIDFAVSGGTALLNEDYVIEIDGVADSDGAGTLAFDPNDPEDSEDAFDVSRAITVRVLNDAVFEVAEDLSLQLSNPVNALLTADPDRAAATVTILDNDLASRPTVGFVEASGVTAEAPGASGTAALQLSGVSGVPVEVDYVFESATATASDYAPTAGSAGTLVFAPGQTTRNLAFTITNDALAEGPEYFRIRITALRNAAPTGAQVHARTITDDDSSGIYLYLDPNGPVDARESDGTIYLPYRVSSNTHSGFQITVSDSGTAQGGLVDYALGSGTFYVQPGATSALLPVQIVNDNTVESSETINLFLVPSFNAVTWLPRTPPFDTIRILDDDAQREVEFALSSQTASEGDGVATVTVALSQPTGQTVVMTLSSAGSTAQAGIDFRIDEPAITIPAGSSEYTTQIEIFDDGQAESEETLVLTLSKSSGNVFLGDQSVHVITIEDNDTPQGPLANFATATSQIVEANADVAVSVPITLAAAAVDEVRVTVALRGGEAVENDDFTINLDPIVFAPGEVEKMLDLSILGDRIPEGDETLILRIVSVTNGSRGALSTHVLTIVDDEGAPTVQFAAAGSPAVENVGAALVPVILTAPAREVVTVDYTVESGTAGSADFDPATGALVFAPGETLAFVSVAVLDDDQVEAPETVLLSLDAATGTALGFPREHVLTLQDDDSPPTVFIGAPGSGTTRSIGEAAGTVPVLISLTRPAVVQSSVVYTVSGTAVAGEDFSLGGGVASFPPGATTALLSLILLDDDVAEDPETIVITLSDPVNLLLGAGTAFTYTVVDDDAPGIACTIPCALQCTSNGLTAGFENATRDALLGVVPNPDSADLGATGIADAAHARLLDLALADPEYVNHCCILAAWNANLDAAGDILDAAFPDLAPQDRDVLQRLLAGIFTVQLVPGGIVVGEGDEAVELDVNNFDRSAWTFLAADGDADMDGVCNAGEYRAAGSLEGFIVAALDPLEFTDGGGCAPCSGEGGACAENGIYTADTLPPGAPDRIITLSELLRVIQFFNSTGFGCEATSEDGYQPNDLDQNCCSHDSDYNGGVADWRIDLSELLRVIQFFNSGGYNWCPGTGAPTEDGFCPGLGR